MNLRMNDMCVIKCDKYPECTCKGIEDELKRRRDWSEKNAINKVEKGTDIGKLEKGDIGIGGTMDGAPLNEL